MVAKRRNARRQSRRAPLQRLAGMGPLLQALMSRLVSVLALLALLVVAWLGVRELARLPVERIVVTGKLEYLRKEALRDAIASELDAGLLFLDLQALRERLQKLPWVYRAQLRRRFPDTLELSVVEQLPIARWGDEAFLNHEARVIEVADGERWQDLPVIRGPGGSESRLMNHYQRLLERLRPLDLAPVALSEDDYGQLAVQLDNGLALELGNRDFALRLQRFLNLWQGELNAAGRIVRRVDMRYEGGAAVKFEEPPQLAGLTVKSGAGRE